MDAILFDLDDTLVVDEAVSLEAMTATAALAARLHGADVPRFLADVKTVSKSLWRGNPALEWCNAMGVISTECLWAEMKDDPAPLRDWAMGFRHALFDAVLRAQELPGDDGVLADAFADSRRRLQRLMPDARETLARLKSSFKIGLLTNGLSGLQREKIAASGLAGFFDGITVSGEHGVGKPKKEIFQILLDALGTRPERAVMVGNSLARDIAGARNANLARAIWLKVPGAEEFAEVIPDDTIIGLHELPPLLPGTR
jgi:putative hydrolase of the HAD superfamily